jgi:UDP-2-acetamido-3-amino-2,3-dideoxy-glucuronate N-acetyltransferase
VPIGEFAFIGAGAVINKDVKPYALMVGVPAKQIGWMSEFGEQIPLPISGLGQYVCPHSKKVYKLNGDKLSTVNA